MKVPAGPVKPCPTPSKLRVSEGARNAGAVGDCTTWSGPNGFRREGITRTGSASRSPTCRAAGGRSRSGGEMSWCDGLMTCGGPGWANAAVGARIRRSSAEPVLNIEGPFVWRGCRPGGRGGCSDTKKSFKNLSTAVRGAQLPEVWFVCGKPHTRRTPEGVAVTGGLAPESQRRAAALVPRRSLEPEFSSRDRRLRASRRAACWERGRSRRRRAAGVRYRGGCACPAPALRDRRRRIPVVSAPERSAP